MSLNENFLGFISRNELDLRNQTIVVGVSCGVDSLCLLNILEKYEKEMGFKIVVCHVNHKRREQSDIEEDYITAYCMKKHPLYVLHFEKSDEHIASFQEMARNKRLDFFKDTLKKVNGKYLFLAHHLNDDMETTFMHLLRGSSLESIAGIKEITNTKDMIIARPFLKILKKEIYEYAVDNSILFFEDCTNSTDDYTRNRVRHNLIPVLFEENPSFNENYLSFKEKMIYSSNLMKEKRDSIINEIFSFENDKVSFELDKYLLIDEVMKKEVLFEVLKKYSFSNSNINEINKIINTEKPQLIVNYKQICIIKEYNKIIILNELYEKKNLEIVINDIGIYHINDKYDLEIDYLDDEKKSKNTISNIDIIWYNSNKFPFSVRNRKDGDKILLSTGHKKVKDLLIDEHVSLVDRDETFLLLDKDNNIISVLGIKKSSILTKELENDLQIKLIRREK